jgi:formylglycine-generating enzyme required for sulfatase activity
MLLIETAKYQAGIVIGIGGVIVRRAFLLGFLFLALCTIYAFPLVYENYKLTSVTPKGKIISDRSYEDKTIRIEFGDFTGDYPEFKLSNISNTPLTIVWDLCAFIDSEGRSDSVLRKGIPFQNRGNSVPSTIVIPGAYVDEIMVPIGSIQYINGEWKATNSISGKAEMTISLVLTVEQQGEQTTYIFGFESVLGSGGVLVESGSFTMGDTWGGGDSNEKPTHKVTLTYDFYIGKYEVTFNEYDAFCDATGRSKPDDEGWGRGQRPVINVSWWDAIAYCNWLSEKEKLPKAYDSNGNLLDKDGRVTTDITKVLGYRLPPEAEWEYAARGGNKSKGYKYAGSDDVDKVAWYRDNSGGRTQEVGKKAPNELGIYDMSGNVWEWCSDWYEDYSGSAQTNPYNNSGSRRVNRGGSWNFYATNTRVAYRSYGAPTYADYGLGFRITRTVPYEGKNRPPLAPYNPNPADESMIIGVTSVTLSWDSYDPDGDTMTYDVYFDTNVNPTTKVSSNQTENTLIRSNLSYETTYYWKVVAKDNHGGVTESPVWKFTTRDLQPKLVFVEKGSFTMGDTWGGGSSDEKPTHKVTLTYDFYIGEYETTFDEYDAFCEATGKSKANDSGWGRGSRPVIYVSWNDAIAYCNWFSEKEGLPKAYDSNGNLLDKDGSITTDPSKVVGYRLPTEAEWEYAARGGNKSEGYKYSGSDNVGDVAWYRDNSDDKTQEVGKKSPNELGIYDMSGNVWEWCSDWYGNYSSYAQTNPYNNTPGSNRVDRGGSWGSSATYSRVARRGYNTPTNASYRVGFRICRTVP